MTAAAQSSRAPKEMRAMEIIMAKLDSVKQDVQDLQSALQRITYDLENRLRSLETSDAQSKTRIESLASVVNQAESNRSSIVEHGRIMTVISENLRVITVNVKKDEERLEKLAESVASILPWMKLFSALGGAALSIVGALLIAILTGHLELVAIP